MISKVWGGLAAVGMHGQSDDVTCIVVVNSFPSKKGSMAIGRRLHKRDTTAGQSEAKPDPFPPFYHSTILPP